MFQLEQLIGNIEMTGMQQKFMDGMKVSVKYKNGLAVIIN